MTVPTSRRRMLGALLLLAMSVAPMLQYGYGALAPFLIADMAISRAEVGLLTSALFTTAALGAPLFGGLVDRLGARAGLHLLFATGALSALLLTGATGYPMLVASAVLAGAPMALANPSTNLLVRQRVPAGERGLLMGVKQSGVQIAGAVAGAALPAIAVLWGWRAAGPLVGGLALVGIALTTRIAGPARPRASGDETGAVAGVPVVVRWVALYAAFMGIGQAVLPGYLTLFGFEQAGLSPQAGGLALTVMGVMGAVGRIAWARHAERSPSLGLPLSIVSGVAALAVLAVASAPWTGPAALFAGAILFGASAPVWNVFAMLAVVRGIDEGAVGRATALIYTGFSLGFITGAPLFGLLVDRTGTYVPSWLATAASCLLATATAWALRRREREPGFSLAGPVATDAGTASF